MTRAYRCTYLLAVLVVLGVKDTIAQGNSELDKRNGFRNIQLGNPISNIPGAKFKKTMQEKDKFPTKLYSINSPTYKRIGEVKVKKIEAKVYKGLIYEIDIITEKDKRLMKAMEKLYQKPHYDLRYNQYTWSSSQVNLAFKSHSKNKIKLVYKSLPMYEMMRQDKSKEIDGVIDNL